MSAREPVDTKRCQAEITPAHGAFVLGPRPPSARCKKKPTVIASDGDGAMSLCAECAEVCRKQMPGVKFWPIGGRAPRSTPEVR